MKPEQQRIAIAKACGWKQLEVDEEDFYWPGGKQTRTVLRWFTPEVQSCPLRLGGLKTEQLPDYCNDLNAMHEAEDKLRVSPLTYQPGGIGHYVCELSRLLNAPPGSIGEWYLIHATAAQRAEAFLRTVGKWEEE